MRYYVRRIAQSVFTLLSGLFLTYAPLSPHSGESAEGDYGGPDRTAVLVGDGRHGTGRRDGRADDGDQPGRTDHRRLLPTTSVGSCCGDFGTSILYQDPVFDILFRAMPWSIFLQRLRHHAGVHGEHPRRCADGLARGLEARLRADGPRPLGERHPVLRGSDRLPLRAGVPVGAVPDRRLAPRAVEPGFNLAFMGGILYHGRYRSCRRSSSGSVRRRSGCGPTPSASSALTISVRRACGVSTNRILTRYLTRNAILPLYTGLVVGIGALFALERDHRTDIPVPGRRLVPV